MTYRPLSYYAAAGTTRDVMRKILDAMIAEAETPRPPLSGGGVGVGVIQRRTSRLAIVATSRRVVDMGYQSS